MNIKWLVVTCLSLAAVTACASPAVPQAASRTIIRQRSLETNGKIANGACDDVGQFIPGESHFGGTLEASAAPTQR